MVSSNPRVNSKAPQIKIPSFPYERPAPRIRANGEPEAGVDRDQSSNRAPPPEELQSEDQRPNLNDSGTNIPSFSPRHAQTREESSKSSPPPTFTNETPWTSALRQSPWGHRRAAVPAQLESRLPSRGARSEDPSESLNRGKRPAMEVEMAGPDADANSESESSMYEDAEVDPSSDSSEGAMPSTKAKEVLRATFPPPLSPPKPLYGQISQARESFSKSNADRSAARRPESMWYRAVCVICHKKLPCTEGAKGYLTCGFMCASKLEERVQEQKATYRSGQSSTSNSPGMCVVCEIKPKAMNSAGRLFPTCGYKCSTVLGPPKAGSVCDVCKRHPKLVQGGMTLDQCSTKCQEQARAAMASGGHRSPSGVGRSKDPFESINPGKRPAVEVETEDPDSDASSESGSSMYEDVDEIDIFSDSSEDATPSTKANEVPCPTFSSPLSPPMPSYGGLLKSFSESNTITNHPAAWKPSPSIRASESIRHRSPALCVICHKKPPYSKGDKNYPTCGLTCASKLEERDRERKRSNRPVQRSLSSSPGMCIVCGIKPKATNSAGRRFPTCGFKCREAIGTPVKNRFPSSRV